MHGNPDEFEAMGNRLGFMVAKEEPRRLELTWRGPRFPAYLCLGIGLLLLGVSFPIIEAIRLRGFIGPAASLWYFPLMNLVLLGIAVYLLSQSRGIVIDGAAGTISLERRSLTRRVRLSVEFAEIEKLSLRLDRVYSGFAMAGSSAAETFPAPALRLILKGGASVLLDRGRLKRLEELGGRIGERIGLGLETEIDAVP